ncbi:MAG TPA: diguanylate cyclase [Gemmatimonadales bacterium]|nr:diguanylate cyclase [Gemmatimonadales bacterium]
MLQTIGKSASLRSWIAIGMAVAVLPLAASAVLGYTTLKLGVIAPFRDVAARARDQIDPTQRLRLLLWETVQPLDAYMDEGDPRDARAYREMRERIEAEFAALHARLRAQPELQALVTRARDDWTAADHLATEAISVRRAPGDPRGAELMDSSNGMIASSVDKLGVVYDTVAGVLRNDHDSALRAFRQAEWLAAAAGAASLAAVLLGVLIIGRVLSASVERLVDGAQRFAAGERDHRIDIQLPPELHRVAREFNRMIGRIHESEDALSDLAQRDALTRLLNRRAFDGALLEAFARQRRLGERFALLLLDLDHFKSVNDTHGHAAGDEVLRRTAQTLGAQLRPFDRLFRIGGEEFAAILGGADGEAALAAAERLRASVAAHPVPVEGAEIPTTVSIGVALGEATGEPRTLLQDADAALYRAKREGRNRAVVGGAAGGALAAPHAEA